MENTGKSKEISSRIKQIRDYLCYGNNKEFANRLGVTPQHGSQLTNEKINVGPKSLEKILIAFPEVSRRWLLTGEGSMIAKSEENDGNNDEKTSEPVIIDNSNCSSIIAQKDVVIESLQAQIKTMQAYIDRLEKTLKDYED